MNEYDLLRGIVTAYPDDTDKGLVEVTVGGYAEGRDTLLVRAEPSLTGVYWLPEIGDVVEIRAPRTPGGEAYLVRVRRPQGDPHTAACWTEKNDRKRIATRSGHTILLDDTRDKTAIRVQTAGGLQFCLEDETKTVTVRAAGAERPLLSLDMENDALCVTAGKRVTVVCAGAEVALDSEGNIRLRAREKLELAAKRITLAAEEKLTLQSD